MRIPGSVCALSSLLAFSLQSSFGDVIDASLRLRFDFAAAPVNNVVIDASLSGLHPGANENATWVASEVGRNGVMDFVAPVADRITVPANPALNSPQGTILFWIKTPGASGPGDYAEIIMDRRTTEGDVITVTGCSLKLKAVQGKLQVRLLCDLCASVVKSTRSLPPVPRRFRVLRVTKKVRFRRDKKNSPI